MMPIRNNLMLSILAGSLIFLASMLLATTLDGGLKATDFVNFAAVLLSVVSVTSCVLVFIQISSSRDDAKKVESLLQSAEINSKHVAESRDRLAEVEHGTIRSLADLLDLVSDACTRLADIGKGTPDEKRKMEALLKELSRSRAKIRIQLFQSDEELTKSLLVLGEIGTASDIKILEKIRSQRDDGKLRITLDYTINKMKKRCL